MAGKCAKVSISTFGVRRYPVRRTILFMQSGKDFIRDIVILLVTFYLFVCILVVSLPLFLYADIDFNVKFTKYSLKKC